MSRGKTWKGGGETKYTSRDRRVTSAENDSAREAEVSSDGGTGDSTGSGSQDYTSGGESNDEYQRFLAQFLGPEGLSPHKRRKP